MVDTTQATSSLADTGIKFVDIVGKVANIALKVGTGIEGVDRVIGPFAAFIPYYSQAIAVVKIADPILSKIAAAAPAVEGAIEAGRPIIEAAQAHGPALVQHVKDVLAIALGHAPGSVAGLASMDAVLGAFGSQMLDGTPLKSVFEASFFTPQDPRFNRVDVASVGG